MNNFLLGYWLGSSGSGDGGNNDNGIGCGTIIIGILVLGAIGLSWSLLEEIVINGKFKEVVTVIKYYLFPSTWDYYYGVAEGRYGWKILIMIANYFFTGIVGAIISLSVVGLLFRKLKEETKGKISEKLLLIIIMPNMFWLIGRTFYYLYKWIF